MDGFHVDPRLKRVELRNYIRYLMSHVFEMHIIPSTSLSLENDTSKICSPPPLVYFLLESEVPLTDNSPWSVPKNAFFPSLGHTTPRLLPYTANAICVRDD